jgi:hypothetical protein
MLLSCSCHARVRMRVAADGMEWDYCLYITTQHSSGMNLFVRIIHACVPTCPLMHSSHTSVTRCLAATVRTVVRCRQADSTGQGRKGIDLRLRYTTCMGRLNCRHQVFCDSRASGAGFGLDDKCVKEKVWLKCPN